MHGQQWEWKAPPPASLFTRDFGSLSHFATSGKKKKIPATPTAKCKSLDVLEVLKTPNFDNFPQHKRKLVEIKAN